MVSGRNTAEAAHLMEEGDVSAQKSGGKYWLLGGGVTLSLLSAFVGALIVKSFFMPVVNEVEDARAIAEKHFAFAKFMATYERDYANADEYEHRRGIYEDNVAEIERVNNLDLSHKLGVNQFADWTNDEYRQMLGYKRIENTEGDVYEGSLDVPESVDWRNKCVTEIKDQGQCGSCWAFSAVGATEGAYCVKTGTLLSLSENQVKNCDRKCFGCRGGLMQYAFEYMKGAGGLCLEADYPYHAINEKCPSSLSCKKQFAVTGYKNVQGRNVDAMKSAIAQQPVAVALDGGSIHFQMYKSGILQKSHCGDSLDHGVLAVGYGTENGVGYWIVKNSWGPKWGESGFIRLSTEGGIGTCGILLDGSFPTV